MKVRQPSAPAEPSTLSEPPVVEPAVPPESTDAAHEPGSRDPLDHDADGRRGGAAPAPECQALVVLKDDPDRGLLAGEVVTVSPADAGPLLTDDVCRTATEQDVALAAPRVRAWSPG